MVLLPLVWVVGIALLWRSRAWTTRDKLVGTLLVPGGLAYPAYVVIDLWLELRDLCPDGGCSWYIDPLTAGLVVAATVIAPLTAIYLAKRADLSRPR